MHTLDRSSDPAIDPARRAALTRLRADVGAHLPAGLPEPLTLVWSHHAAVGLDRGTPWLWGPVQRDPLMGPAGPAVLPRRQQQELKRIVAAALPFAAVGVAHELDPDGPVRLIADLLCDGPRTCSDAVARELVGPVPPHPGVARATGMLDALVGGAAARVSHTLEVLLDPIVFGVAAPWPLVHGAPSLWYPLVAWRW